MKLTALSAVAVTLLVGCDAGLFSPNPPGDPSGPVIKRMGLGSPPPISGGTLITLKGSARVAAADPDTDNVWFVNVGATVLVAGVELPIGAQPGRLVEDGKQRVHVVLRGTGEVASLDARGSEPKLIGTRAVCGEPRGIAYDAPNDTLVVACAGGELVMLDAEQTASRRTLLLDDDLRDVAAVVGGVVVSRFHSAEVLVIDVSTGQVISRTAQPELVESPVFFGFDAGTGAGERRTFTPGTAWRMTVTPQGVAMTYQRGLVDEIPLSSGMSDPTQPNGSPYGGGACRTGVVGSVVSLPGAAEPIALMGALPVDLALSGTGAAAVVLAGDRTIALIDPAQPPTVPPGFPGCAPPQPGTQLAEGFGTPVAVTFVGESVVVQTRDPSGIVTAFSSMARFPTQADHDEGHLLFHVQAPAGLACASCHPDGREDGRVWHFLPDGPRRTQSLAGGVLQTAPFHWDGTLDTTDALMREVLVKRMGAQQPSGTQVAQLGAWLDTIKRPAARGAELALAEHGKVLFESAAVGCAACHLGPHLTNNANADVGTGRQFQVPSLVGLSARAPFMHDGCAKTLEQRFDPACGGGDKHGVTSSLSAPQVADLVAYLKTL